MVSTLLLLIVGVAALWNQHALDGIHYQRRFFYRRAFPGETSPVELVVENNKLLPVAWLRIADNWPDGVGPDESAYQERTGDEGYRDLVHLFSLRWFGRIRRRYDLTFKEEGSIRLVRSDWNPEILLGCLKNKMNSDRSNTSPSIRAYCRSLT